MNYLSKVAKYQTFSLHKNKNFIKNNLGKNNTTENSEIKNNRNVISNELQEKEKIETKKKIDWN